MAAKHHLGILALMGMVEIAHTIVERSLVNNSIDESRKVAHITHLDFFQHLANHLLYLGPQALRHVCAAGCRTLLSLKLESSAHDGCGHLLGIGTMVNKNEVLTARLTHNLGIGAIVGNIVAYRLPEAVECRRGACEVHTSQILVGESHIANQRAATRQEVDHTVGQSSLLVNLHQQIVAQQSRGRRLPYTHVAHQHWTEAQVAGNRGEVERGNGKHKTLQRTIADVVERPLVATRLVAVDLRGIISVVA